MADSTPAPSVVGSRASDYQKLNLRQHILQRPETYVGAMEKMAWSRVLVPQTQNHSTEKVESTALETMLAGDEVDETMEGFVEWKRWATDRGFSVFPADPGHVRAYLAHSATLFTVRDVTDIIPAMLKIFDEILVNAADNKQRCPGMNRLKVDFLDDGGVRVYNNGDGLPVEEHPKHKLMVPILVFGHLLTGSNFDDAKKKTTGGRNGYGAKCTNIYSTKFIVETSDGQNELTATWTDNMTGGVAATPPAKGSVRVRKTKKKPYTQITFYPDLSKFQVEEIPQSVRDVMVRRVHDVAGCTDASLRVSLNGEELRTRNFSTYCEQFPTHSGSGIMRVYDETDRWKVCVMPNDHEVGQHSFVNSIWTRNGGKHVEHVQDQLYKAAAEHLRKKHKLDVKPKVVKDQLCVVVAALIDNPTFDTQSKEQLTTQTKRFGSTWTPSKRFLTTFVKSAAMDAIVRAATAKQDQELTKQDGKKTSRVKVDKLYDAGMAGTRRSQDCTLILTEGDSAAALAVGARPNGKQWGVLALRGKVLNVREKGAAAVAANREFQNIKTALGLRQGQVYHDTAQLRYGSVLLMADQDYDGFHITGLLMNMFHYFWPSLLHIEGFFKRMQTPIVKVTRGAQTREFFSMDAYEAWQEETDDAASWKAKYYKGLGTNSAKEGKGYFADLSRYLITFSTSAEDDEVIDRAFNRTRADDRKEWLRAVPSDILSESSSASQTGSTQTCTDFINNQLVQFSLYNVLRSIAHLVDGLKVSQRKIVWQCLQDSNHSNSSVKVAQLAARVAFQQGYHHGEQNLCDTMVGLAQNFVGAHNIPLLHGEGQFGTRLEGGSDSASPRYIFTKLAELTRYIFPRHDDAVLERQEEEGKVVEPICLVPILPMVLVNGQEGIGTGFSTWIPKFHPRDVLRNTRRMLHGEPLEPIVPWYRNFRGSIELGENHTFTTSGVAEWVGSRELHITELPIGTWTAAYKEVLDKLCHPKGLLVSFTEDHTDTRARFELIFREDHQKRDPIQWKPLKLIKSFSMRNMHLFSDENTVTRYGDIMDIFTIHHKVRLAMYVKRRAKLLQDLEARAHDLSEKARYITLVLERDVELIGADKPSLMRELEHTHHFADPEKLVAMRQDKLTKTEYERLKREVEAAQQELRKLQDTTPQQLWEHDLDDLEEHLQTAWSERDDDEATPKSASAPKKKKRKAPTSSKMSKAKLQKTLAQTLSS